MRERRFNPHALTVAPELAGALLPSPRRRAAALAVDLLLLVLPTLIAALAFAGLALRLQDPAGFAAVRALVRGEAHTPAERHAILRQLAPLLVRIGADGLPAAVAADVEAGELDRAADRLTEMNFTIVLGTEAKAASPPPGGSVRLDLARLIPSTIRTAALFLMPALYFAIGTARGGATPGKRLLGLRVVRLDGRPLTLLEGLERFGSYFAVLGTIGFGLADLWRDPNRRLAHDRAAETVVVHRGRRRRA